MVRYLEPCGELETAVPPMSYAQVMGMVQPIRREQNSDSSLRGFIDASATPNPSDLLSGLVHG